MRAVAAAFVLAGVVLLPAALAADQTFTGRWEVVAVGAGDPVVFEFRDGGQITVFKDGEVDSEMSYTVDTDLRTIEISENGSPMVFSYRFPSSDMFLFYLSGDTLEAFAGQITRGLDEGSNDLTRNLAQAMREAMIGAFAQNPFMRGSRLVE